MNEAIFSSLLSCQLFCHCPLVSSKTIRCKTFSLFLPSAHDGCWTMDPCSWYFTFLRCQIFGNYESSLCVFHQITATSFFLLPDAENNLFALERPLTFIPVSARRKRERALTFGTCPFFSVCPLTFSSPTFRQLSAESAKYEREKDQYLVTVRQSLALARGTRLSLSFDPTFALTLFEEYDGNETRTEDSSRLVCLCNKKPPRPATVPWETGKLEGVRGREGGEEEKKSGWKTSRGLPLCQKH